KLQSQCTLHNPSNVIKYIADFLNTHMKFSGMKKNFTVVVGIAVFVISSALIFFSTHENKKLFTQVKDMDEEQDKRDEYTTLRWLHEFNMLKDPVLNRIPAVASKELSQAHAIPEKQYEILAG